MSFALKRSLFSWFSLWVIGGALGLYFLLPLRQSLRFGIDLVGGTYIRLQVETEKAIKSELDGRAQALSSYLSQASATLPSDTLVEGKSLVASFSSADAAHAARSVLESHWKDMSFDLRGSTLTMTLGSSAQTQIAQDAVEGNIKVLRTRLDQVGAAEIGISRHGEKDIVIEIPDVKDPAQAKAMIGKAAVLEFKLVHGVGRSPEDVTYDLGGYLPSTIEIIPGKEVAGRTSAYYAVDKYPVLTGNALRKAFPSFDQMNKPVVSFEFDVDAGQTFYEFTGKNIGRQLAVVLDGVVITAPNIQTQLRESGVITGSKDGKEVSELAMLLNSGAFLAPVKFEEERQIGPSLGAESIRQGLFACLVSLVLLFFFSAFYYKGAGLLAFIALLFNVLVILLGLSFLGATLTLPGIAGIVLTLGMAIDASILIYERIKEELSRGVPVRNAVYLGFSDAMMVIIDANITTFIVGVVLYRFGTGPVQGFAVTMMLGIAATLVTGLFFLRSFFTFILDNFRLQKLSI